MTKEEFDNYHFSIKTEIKTKNNNVLWQNVLEVDFRSRIITTTALNQYSYSNIAEIRN